MIKLCFAKAIAENIHRENFHNLLKITKNRESWLCEMGYSELEIRI